MTPQQILAILTNYQTALTNLDLTQVSHQIGDASYDHDAHRDSLVKGIEYWNNLYNRKISAGRSPRMDYKSV